MAPVGLSIFRSLRVLATSRQISPWSLACAPRSRSEALTRAAFLARAGGVAGGDRRRRPGERQPVPLQSGRRQQGNDGERAVAQRLAGVEGVHQGGDGFDGSECLHLTSFAWSRATRGAEAWRPR